MEKFDIANRDIQPDKNQLIDLVGSPLFEELLNHIEEEYKVLPEYSYSGCSLQPGWNVKYKKSGKALCTIYPLEGEFIVLIVVGQKEKDEVEFKLGSFSNYTKNLYENTKEGMGQRWLMIEVKDEATLQDVKELIAIRRNSKGVRK